ARLRRPSADARQARRTGDLPTPMSTPAPRHYLVMTATITPPPDAPGLTRTDPQLRHDDYQIALTHYCALLGDCLDGIVFAENSGSDLTDLRRLAAESTAGPVEFLALDAR